MDKSKGNDLAAMLRSEKSGLNKAVNKQSNNNNLKRKKKSQVESEKIHRSTGVKEYSQQHYRRKPIRYSNIRTNASIVRKLGIMKKVHGSSSRAELLNEMIRICWPKFIRTAKQKREAKKIAIAQKKIAQLKHSM